MNKSEVIERLTERLGDKTVATEAVDGLIDIIGRSLAKGERVAISGFGTWERVERGARTARNPATGATVKVKKTSVPKFKAGAGLKGIVNGTTKLGREPRHEPLLPQGITSAASRRKVDAALGAAPAAAKAPAVAAAKAPAKAAAKKAPAKAAAVKAVKKAPAKAAAKAPAAKKVAATTARKATTTVRRAAAATKATAAKATKAPATKTAPAKRAATKAAPARAAAKKTAAPAKKAPARRAGGAVDVAEVRAWARQNGVTVSTRGRISQDIIDQYRAASR